MFSTANFVESIRLIELDGGERCIDADAVCARRDGCRLCRPEQSRTYPKSRGFAPNVNGRPMLVLLDAVRRKTQHLTVAIGFANCDVEDSPRSMALT